MRTLACLLPLVMVSPIWAQENLQVLPASSEPRQMLYKHLLAQAQKHFDARRLEIAKLKSPEDIKKRQDYLRDKFLQALGGLPDKTPLNAHVVGTVPGEEFRVDKVIYESRPNHHVTANFYLPEGKGPFPGVLLPCGHSVNGKAAETYQRAAILMARNGLAVLCYDPIGQGERLQLIADGKPGIPGSTSEHTMVGVGALLVGKSTATYRIWDGIRSLDYLASRPEVDAKRLGCTGNSGGGTLTAYLMALDDRIVAAAPSCYITTLEKLFATLGPQDAEQNITGQVAFGMEHADYLTLRAPRPTLLAVGTYDYFDIQGAWTTFREASLIYGKLGHGERVALFEYEDKHGFSRPRREACMRWMRRWLLDKNDAPAEIDFPIFKDEQLQCTRSGQVLEDFKGRSVFHLNAELERELAKKRMPLPGDVKERTALLRGLLGMPAKIADTQFKEENAPVKRKNYVIRQYVLGVGGMQFPALEFAPAKADTNEWVIYLAGDGMANHAGSGGPLEKLADAGHHVLAVDSRGWGETSPQDPAKVKDALFGADSKHAFLSLHLSRPLLGQRVQDVLAIMKHFHSQDAKSEISFHLIGVGAAGPVALHAAALESRVKKVTLENALISWSSVVHTPVSINQLTNVVPGVLQYYDLPELAGTLAPRALTVRNPLDASQRAVSQSHLETVFRPCQEIYAKHKGQLVLQAGQ